MLSAETDGGDDRDGGDDGDGGDGGDGILFSINPSEANVSVYNGWVE